MLFTFAVSVRLASVICAFARILHFASATSKVRFLLSHPVNAATFVFALTTSPKVSVKTVFSSGSGSGSTPPASFPTYRLSI